jgi:hypothetical protein
MAATTSRTVEQPGQVSEPDQIDTSRWPPMPEAVRAAHLRMLREPDLFDEFGDDWVAFAGDEIVASGPDHDEVMLTAERKGKTVSLMVPIMRGWM